jgi:hypothetical protein
MKEGCGLTEPRLPNIALFLDQSRGVEGETGTSYKPNTLSCGDWVLCHPQQPIAGLVKTIRGREYAAQGKRMLALRHASAIGATVVLGAALIPTIQSAEIVASGDWVKPRGQSREGRKT